MTHLKSKLTKVIPTLAVIAALGACETSPGEGLESSVIDLNVTATNSETGEGRYYPTVSYTETPELRFGPMLNIVPSQRVFFSDQINLAATSGERMVPIVVQAVGEERQTLVFLALDATQPLTPYISRAVLARMTSLLRFAPAVAEMGISQELDVYNMAALLGFKRIVVTDGRTASHESLLEAASMINP